MRFCIRMIHLTINPVKTKFPLEIAKGTAQERIQKAVGYSDRFFDNIKDYFKDGDVSTRTFASVLRKTAGDKVGIEVFEKLPKKSAMTCRNYNDKMVQIGYALFLPVNSFSKKISKMSTKTFMHEVFHFFDHLLNPKYNKRIHNLINSGISYQAGPFYSEKIYTKENLTKQMLNTALKGLTPQQKIDALQFFRYSLILERNAYIHSAKYQKMMENYYKDCITYHEKPYKYTEYKFDEKIKLIEETLLRIIQKERAKI